MSFRSRITEKDGCYHFHISNTETTFCYKSRTCLSASCLCLRGANLIAGVSLIPREFGGIRAFGEDRDARLRNEVPPGIVFPIVADATVGLDRVVAIHDHTLQLGATAHDDVIHDDAIFELHVLLQHDLAP